MCELRDVKVRLLLLHIQLIIVVHFRTVFRLCQQCLLCSRDI